MRDELIEAIGASDLRATQKAVLAALAWHVAPGGVIMSVDDLHRWTGISAGPVRDALHALAVAGCLTIEARRGASAVYRLSLAEIVATPTRSTRGTPTRTDRGGPVEIDTPTGSDRGTPPSSERGGLPDQPGVSAHTLTEDKTKDTDEDREERDEDATPAEDAPAWYQTLQSFHTGFSWDLNAALDWAYAHRYSELMLEDVAETLKTKLEWSDRYQVWRCRLAGGKWGRYVDIASTFKNWVARQARQQQNGSRPGASGGQGGMGSYSREALPGAGREGFQGR